MSGAAASMDSIYRVQRHFYDATRRFYLLGRDELIDALAPAPGASILEVGCGTGRNLILAAQKYPRARCFGIDVSRAMLETASASIARSGLEARVRVAAGDAARLDPAGTFGLERFDAVFISYALSMIPGWRAVIDSACGHLEPGGALHVVDFGDQHGLPPLFQSALRAWLAKFSVTLRPDLRGGCEAAARRRGYRCEFRHLYRGYAALARISA